MAVVFYNAENLFDFKNDTTTNDDEFTPEGERHWTYNRFEDKIVGVSKVLISAIEWDTPAIIGICEIENRYVLDRLIKDTPLNAFSFSVVHKESPDPRGIDVALLYNSKVFYPLKYEYYPLPDKEGGILKTREILHVSGILSGQDTVHVFVNHWPSRYSGLLETRDLRNTAADLLRKKVDAVFMRNQKAKVIIMGDFNDQPTDESIKKCLKASESSDLVNLSESWMNSDTGTLKYQAQWFVFDQIIVSSALLEEDRGVYTKPSWASIVDADFLLEPDERYGGFKPFRTYVGYRYHGGFGDHLPVKLQLEVGSSK